MVTLAPTLPVARECISYCNPGIKYAEWPKFWNEPLGLIRTFTFGTFCIFWCSYLTADFYLLQSNFTAWYYLSTVLHVTGITNISGTALNLLQWSDFIFGMDFGYIQGNLRSPLRLTLEDETVLGPASLCGELIQHRMGWSIPHYEISHGLDNPEISSVLQRVKSLCCFAGRTQDNTEASKLKQAGGWSMYWLYTEILLYILYTTTASI